ncbi:MAG: GlsB/YeaQ/YmgE family stress response membrane protein [Myxococcota bacterium]
MTILGFLILGLVAGAVARFLLPGRDPMGLLGTMLLGVAGSFLGGFLFNVLLAGGDVYSSSGLCGSIAGAMILLGIMRLAAGNRRRVP